MENILKMKQTYAEVDEKIYKKRINIKVSCDDDGIPRLSFEMFTIYAHNNRAILYLHIDIHSCLFIVNWLLITSVL